MAGQRILVVDDEPDIRDLLEEVLKAEGFDVATAGTAAEGLKLARASLYDAAIIDFSLPDMNGVALHHQIRLVDEDLAARTVFISALAQSPTQMDYYWSSSAGFIEKPFDIPTILEAIRHVLDRS